MTFGDILSLRLYTMKILLATDGTKQSDSAVEMLRNFRLTDKDTVKIVSVVEMAVPLAIDVYGGYLPDTTEIEKAARDNATRVLDAAITTAKGIGAPAEVTGEVLYGSPESQIGRASFRERV